MIPENQYGNIPSPGLLHALLQESMSLCPYNRMNMRRVRRGYQQAVKQEIDLYAPYLEGMSFPSLYIGGGTPTVNWPGLVSILDHLKRRLGSVGNICIELHPANMDDDCLMALKEVGVTMLSVGVESTSDNLLEQIKRSHDSRTAIHAVERALRIGFESVNVDLMFAIPGQSAAAWQADVRTIVDLGVDQLSTYPMFSFPYSDLGKTKGIRQVERPAHHGSREC